MRLPSVTRKTDNKNKHDTASWLPDEQEEEMTQEADDILRAIVMKDCGVTMILSEATSLRRSS